MESDREAESLAAAAAATSSSLPPLPPRLLVVRESPGRGRGVFAAAPIARGALVEAAPVLVFASDEYAAHGRHTLLDHYTFRWERGAFALALGFGSLFNHAAREPARNTGWVRDVARSEIRYSALRDIAAGEELLISYGARVWFGEAGAGAEGEGEGEGPAAGGAGAGGDEGSLSDEDDNIRLARIGVATDED
jgi:tRNA-specific adenosine deaminase 3